MLMDFFGKLKKQKIVNEKRVENQGDKNLAIIKNFSSSIENYKSTLTDEPSVEMVGELNSPASSIKLRQLESFVGESLPKDFKDLYMYANGQDDGCGIFYGNEFLSLEAIMSQLELSKQFSNKSAQKILSKKTMKELVNYMLSFVDDEQKNNDDARLRFAASKNSIGGAVIVSKDVKGIITEKPLLTSIDHNYVFGLLPKIFDTENPLMELLADMQGNYSASVCETTEIPTTSVPDSAIKQLYYHNKWVPIFGDYCGNYIGIDLDPDINGVRGQVIKYGRDEQQMHVLANSLAEYLKITKQKGYFDR